MYIKFFVCVQFYLSASGSHITVERQPDTLTTINLTDPLILRCFMEGNTGVNIEWNWKEANAHDPEYYFKVISDIREIATGLFESSSILGYKDDLDDETKKSARGTLIASATDDGHTVSCNDATLEIQWAASGLSLSITTDPGPFLEDQTLSIACSITDPGNPAITSTYFTLNDDPFARVTHISRTTYRIDSLKRSDSGNLKCCFRNDAGTSCSKPVGVVVQWPASGIDLSIPNGPGPFLEDQTFEITCSNTDPGNPAVTLADFTLDDDPFTRVTHISGTTYSINSIQRSDAGNLKCCFSNDAGASCSKPVDVVVQYRPSQPELQLNVDMNNIRFGDNFTLQCSSQPGVKTVWLKNGDVQDGPNFTDDKITITHADASVNGVWSCYASNEVGKSSLSNAIEISAKCIPDIHIDYITYEITSELASFNLKIRDPFAASTLEISVCSVDDNPSCNTEQQSNIEHNNTIEQNVVLPGSSDDEVYNVTFIFSDDYRIVTRHGIALKGSVVQSQVPTILSVLFGTLLIVAIFTIMALVYVFVWRNKATGTSVPRENSMHYANVGSEGNAGDIAHIQAAPEYEDVNAGATNNGRNSNIGNATYMDLDQSDIQQTRNRPVEVTVYQSLN